MDAGLGRGMEQTWNQVLREASNLTSRSLSPVESRWIIYVCNTIKRSFEMVFQHEELLDTVLEASIVAIRNLSRNGRFPTSFSIVSISDLTSFPEAVNCSYADAWDVLDSNEVTKGGFKGKKMIMIGWLATNDTGAPLTAIQAQYGSILSVHFPDGQVLPCVAHPDNLPSVYQIFLSTNWSYCPFSQPNQTSKPLERLFPGFLELRSSLSLPHNSLDYLRLQYAPNNVPISDSVVMLHDAIDPRTESFRKATIQPKGRLVSLFATLNKVSPVYALDTGETTVLLELVGDMDAKITVFIDETPETLHLLASAQLLQNGSQIVVSNLKPSMVAPLPLRPQIRFLATAKTHLVPLPFIDSHESLDKKAKKSKTVENENSSLIASCTGQVTNVINSRCFEIDGNLKVYAHRSIYGHCIRVGSILKFKFVHHLYENKTLIGLGLCTQSTIEVIEFAPKFMPMTQPHIEVRNPKNELPSFELAVFVETWRNRLNFNDYLQKSDIYTIAQFLLRKTQQDWAKGLFCPNLPLVEWLSHDAGAVGSNLGCQAHGVDSKAFPTPLALKFFTTLKTFSPLPPWPVWSHELINPMAYLENINNRVIVGVLRASSTRTQVQSNYVWFETANGDFQVPILLSGIHLWHLDIPCRLLSFLVVKENTIFSTGEEKPDVEKRINPTFSYGFYLSTSIEQVQFARPPNPREGVPHMSNPNNANAIVFKILQKRMPSYSQEFLGLSIRTSMVVEVLTQTRIVRPGIHELVFDCPRSQIFALLREKGVYYLGNMTSFEENSRFRHNKKKTANHPVITVSEPPVIYEVPTDIANTVYESKISTSAVIQGQTATKSVSSTLKAPIKRLVSLREYLNSASNVSFDQVACKAVILARKQESVTQSFVPAQYNNACRFLLGDPREIRSNVGSVTLVLRALEGPDTLVLYFKPNLVSLPLGLVPGAVICLSRLKPALSGKSKLNLYVNNGDQSLEFLGFDPNLLSSIGHSLWPSLQHLPLVQDIFSASRNFEIAKDASGMIKRQNSNLNHFLRYSVVWTDYNVPRQWIRDLPAKSIFDRRIFQARLNVMKYFDFKLERRCASCHRIMARACPYGCTENRSFIQSSLVAEVYDGSGVAKACFDGESMWNILPISKTTQNELKSITERVSSIKFDKKALYVANRVVRAEELLFYSEQANLDKTPIDEMTGEVEEFSLQEDDIEDDQEPKVDKTYWQNVAISFRDMIPLKRLRDALINGSGEPIIAMYHFVAQNREGFYPFESLPYHIPQADVAIAVGEKSVLQLVTKTKPLIDIVWTYKLKSEIRSECLAHITQIRAQK